MNKRITIATGSVVASAIALVVTFVFSMRSRYSGGSENWAPLMNYLIGAWMVIFQAVFAVMTLICMWRTANPNREVLLWCAVLFPIVSIGLIWLGMEPQGHPR